MNMNIRKQADLKQFQHFGASSSGATDLNQADKNHEERRRLAVVVSNVVVDHVLLVLRCSADRTKTNNALATDARAGAQIQ